MGALLIFIVFPVFWLNDDLSLLVLFFAAVLIMCFFARIGGLWRRIKGERSHSYYTGYPWIMFFFPRSNEITIKRIVEPAFIFFAGVFLIPISKPLAAYLMLAALGLLISVGMSLHYEHIRALDIQDAWIEQRQLADRVRRMNGNGR